MEFQLSDIDGFRESIEVTLSVSDVRDRIIQAIEYSNRHEIRGGFQSNIFIVRVHANSELTCNRNSSIQLQPISSGQLILLHLEFCTSEFAASDLVCINVVHQEFYRCSWL